jgi:hypothetical protein
MRMVRARPRGSGTVPGFFVEHLRRQIRKAV